MTTHPTEDISTITFDFSSSDIENLNMCPTVYYGVLLAW